MSILSGEEPLIDRLMRAYNKSYETPTADAPVFGIPSLALPQASPKIGVQASIVDTPPVPPTAGSPPPALRSVGPGSLDIPPPTSPAPIMDKPTYEYMGNGFPVTDPVTVGPDPRSDLSSEAGQAWLAKARPNILNTPAGPASMLVNTYHGGQQGLTAFYSPEQLAQQQARGINLIGHPFEWTAESTAQLNAALAQRARAESDARYLMQKGIADVEVAKAATAGKLAMYDPQRMQTEMLLEAGKQNPMLWQTPEFKQKVGVPLTAADKLSLAQAAHPGLNVAEGLQNITHGYAPGTSRLMQMLDASRFGMTPLSPAQKIQQALATMTPAQAEEWQRVAEVMGLINPVTGRKSR